MTRLYAKARLAPVCAVLMLASCATAPDRPSAAVDAAAADSPEEVLARFTAAWNSGRPDEIVATFSPARRARVRGALDDIAADQARLVVVDGTVQAQCHPRGSYWKTAVIRFDLKGNDRRSAAPRDEIVWLRLQNGGWWMYSL